jgi:hypothetical protein
MSLPVRLALSYPRDRVVTGEKSGMIQALVLELDFTSAVGPPAIVSLNTKNLYREPLFTRWDSAAEAAASSVGYFCSTYYKAVRKQHAARGLCRIRLRPRPGEVRQCPRLEKFRVRSRFPLGVKPDDSELSKTLRCGPPAACSARGLKHRRYGSTSISKAVV